MPSPNGSGTQTAVVGTEHVLDTTPGEGTFLLVVDLSAMAAGDIVELRIKLKVLAGSTQKVAYLDTFTGVQADPIEVSMPIPVTHEMETSLEQTAGVARSFNWEIIQV